MYACLLGTNHPFTKQKVLSLCPELLTQSSSSSSLHALYKVLPSINNIFLHVIFSNSSTFIFITHFFMDWDCMNPKSSYILNFYSFTWLSNNSVDGFQPNLCQHFPRVFFTYHTIFSLKLMNVLILRKAITLQDDIDSCITHIPTNDLHI